MPKTCQFLRFSENMSMFLASNCFVSLKWFQCANANYTFSISMIWQPLQGSHLQWLPVWIDSVLHCRYCEANIGTNRLLLQWTQAKLYHSVPLNAYIFLWPFMTLTKSLNFCLCLALNLLKTEDILRKFQKVIFLSQRCKDFRNNDATWKLVSIPLK
jgi:hypothetical protein